MRKFFFSLIGVLLLSTTAFGSDVLFKMEMLHTSSVSTAASSSTNLGAYAIVFGGTAEVVNTTNDNRNIIAYAKDTSYLTINSGGYIHIVLDRALAVGDKILYTEYKTGSSGHTILATRANSRSRYNNNRNTLSAGTEFAVPQATDELAGATELWIWYDNNTACVKSLTITRTNVNPLAIEYLFNGEEVGAIGDASSTTTLNNDLIVNNDGSKNNAIANLAGSKVLFLAGAGSDRVAMFNVTDPCTIEIWGRSSSSTARTVYIAEGSYKSTSSSTAVTGLSSVARSQLYKGTYNYTGVEDNKTIYVQVDGGFHIAAIRVTYPRIRPATDLSVDKPSLTMRTSTSAKVTASTSSDVAIDRSAIGSSSLVSISNTDKVYTIRAKEAGEYTMILTQAASEYYRAGRVEIPITIADEVAIDAPVNATNGTISGGTENNGPIWTSLEGKITLIAGTTSDNRIRIASNHCSSPTPSSEYLLLANGETYTITVPSNKTIKSVSFSGYSNTSKDNNTSYIDGVNSDDCFPSYKNDDVTAKKVTVSSLNTKSYSFTVKGGGLIAAIDLKIEESYAYPVTITSGWASFCAPEDVTIADGLTAYLGSEVQEESGDKVLVLTEIEGGKIKANTGVVLAGTNGTYNLTATIGAASMTSSLTGTTARTANPNTTTTYGLNSSAGEFQQYQGKYIPANKAYLTYETSGSAPARLRMQIGPKQVPTDVDAISNQPAAICMKTIENGQLIIIRDGVKYNVQGQIVK